MSKASDWVRRVSDANETRPLGFGIGNYVKATVTAIGHCQLRGECVLTPDQALALAAYLIDTFGEPPTPAGEVRE